MKSLFTRMTNLSSQPKIKDLIEVPAVKTVIELATVRDAAPEDLSQLIQLIESFVVTEDIEKCLRTVLDQMTAHPDEGMGFFLTGNFGSGKSHLLAVFSLLLQHMWAWESIANQSESLRDYESRLSERRFLVVQIPLLEYRQVDTLEEIVWQSIENTLASSRYGIVTSLAPDSAFLEGFAKYVLPAHHPEISAFLEVQYKYKGQWETLRKESPQDALQYAQEYLRTAGHSLPFRLALDRQTAWDKLTKTLADYEIDGLVLLIDELSEFLRSKADARALNEDTRFLQFVGERATHFPVWVIAALQEVIEKTGDISQTTFNKIKDRYPHRLELSTRHLRELIDHRLILKKGDSAIQAIRGVYRQLKGHFQRLQISEDAFLQIYPVHPETLELLDTNSRFFSQRRGVIDFIHCQVRGDASRGTPGMLSLGAEMLLTPDKIFDHFALRLREQIDLSPYYEIYTNYFDRQIPRIFTDESDQHFVRKLIKILILLKLSPMAEERTVRELADMLLFRAIELGGDLNYEYIEGMLTRLYAEAGYLRVTPGAEAFSDVYQLDLDANVVDQVRVKVRDIVQGLSDNDGRPLNTLFTRIVEGALPFAHLNGVYNERKNIQWENTLRSGWVKLCNLLELSEDELTGVITNLRQSEGDFVLYVGVPFSVDAQRDHFQQLIEKVPDRFAHGVICWLPAPIPSAFPDRGDEAAAITEMSPLQLLKTFYAYVQLAKDQRDAEPNTELQSHLDEWIAQNEPQIRTLIDECYFAGKVYTASGQLRRNLDEWRFLPFNTILARVVQKPLRDLFPHHIAPQGEIHSWRVVSELVDDFVRPGELSRADGAHQSTRNLIESICVPFKLVRKRRKSYQLELEPSTPVIDQIVGHFDVEADHGASSHDYSQIYWHVRKSEYGTPAPLFDLLLFALIRQGYLIAYQSGARLTISQLKLPLDRCIEHLGKGELIGDEYRWQLGEVAQTLLREELSSYDISRQEDLWNKLCKVKDQFSRDLTAGRERLQTFSDRISTDDGELGKVLESISQLQRMIAEIKPSLNAKEGLEHFLQAVSDRGLIDQTPTGGEGLANLMSQAGAVKQFAATEADALLEIHTYLSSPHLSIPDAPDYDNLRELKQAVDSQLQLSERLIFGGGASEIMEAFQLFRDTYADRYFAEHGRINRVDVAALERMRSAPGYSLLGKLGQIRWLSLSVDCRAIDSQITQERGRVCNRLNRADLNRMPACVCGFRLGEKIQPLDPAQLLDRMRHSVQQTIAILQKPPHREELEAYIAQLTQVDAGTSTEELVALMDADLEHWTDETCGELDRQLTPETIAHLNKALEGGVKIVRRDLSTLIKVLAGKQYRKAELWQVIQQWIEENEGLDEDVFVLIEDGKEIEGSH
ncbi:MAG: DUF6079 family protein [Candidatus Poribacteria bacterium]|nr:DUF6079 family protein [Candidatus Poribacteria bacterium]